VIKAAVVGLGIGHAHCAGYLESPCAELAAVCDLMPQRLARVGGTFEAGSMTDLRQLYAPELLGRRWEDLDIQTHTSLEELLAEESIEILSLCTPDDTHAELAVRILKAGKHLLLEKPLALSLEDAEIIGRTLESAPGTFSVGYEYRLNPAVLQLRRLVAGGFVGTVEAFTLHHFRRPFKRDKWQQWIQQERSSGGLIVEETSHWLDLLRFVTAKEVAALRCNTTDRIHPDFDYEDIAFIQGTLEGKGIFQLSHALSGFDFNLVISVHGSEGTPDPLLRAGGLGTPERASGVRRNRGVWARGDRALQHKGIYQALRRVCCPGRTTRRRFSRRLHGPGVGPDGPA
jgi:predicted dehydrogenase